ncbi:GNAT family N-acetyltransferase [Janthinobacterium sp. SUN118]|uniref:GNAT family N-acetyltransferase n=1 Tax=Janthinobacterium sp. SUN118 TaxID=3004100 RepID=UPI0025B139E4|nr:GNAT family N-acetyltransferase [Janthinobacterium sp. SUN118]MDN2710106.1 GNAT family N-acetyltransferase [Janthinobacterium sp. SUN118]
MVLANDTLISPAAVVQAQLDAYNAHDVPALLAIYSDDAQQFQHPDTLLATGAAQIASRFTARFAASRPQAQLLNRIACGKLVIDHEIVHGDTDDGVSAQELVATYEVAQGRIARAWFSFGALTRLRVALPSDVPAMNALIARSGVELSTGFYTLEQAEAVTRHVFGVDTQLVADQTYFVIERDGAMLACGGWSRRATLYGADRAKSGPDPLLDPTSQPGRIRAFFVDPAAARQGLGSMLMRHCERQARAAGFTALELAATLPGVPLYLASGFATTQEFHLDLPGGIQLPLARMHKRL